MYHYMGSHNATLPYFRYMHINDFEKQLDYFGENYRFISKNEFKESIFLAKPIDDGIILTFDDGFKDHYQNVLTELKKRNIWGIFYIPTAPYQTGKLLDVHRLHLLIGKWGGKKIFRSLTNIISESMLSHTHVHGFRTQTYRTQTNDEYTKHVKRTLNYYISYEYRERVIDALMAQFFPDETKLVQQFYLSREEIKEMSETGMIIGSHTVNHLCMSKLEVEKQESEIVDSFNYLRSIIGNFEFKTFCYPYGGFHSFTKDTELLLEKVDCDFSFNVEPRNINNKDLSERKQALPRFDCNMFPYGLCRPVEV